MSKDKRLMIFEDQLLAPQVTEFFSGWRVQPMDDVLKEHKPLFKWNKSKIPYAVWEEIVSFMRWGQATHKSEVLLALFYNTEEDQWAAWAFPQTTQGMTVQFDDKHADYKIDRRQFGNGWIQLGSVHHHCTTGAFASGVDKEDEEDREGVHITLGHMDKPNMDIHIRQTFTGIVGEVKPEDFIATPDWLEAVPDNYKKRFIKKLFTELPEGPFNPIWKARVTKRTYGYTGYQGPDNYQGRYAPHNNGQGHVWDPTTRKLVPKQQVFDDEDEFSEHGGYWPVEDHKQKQLVLNSENITNAMSPEKAHEFEIADSCDTWEDYLKVKLPIAAELPQVQLVHHGILEPGNIGEFTMLPATYERITHTLKCILDYAECPEEELLEYLAE